VDVIPVAENSLEGGMAGPTVHWEEDAADSGLEGDGWPGVNRVKIDDRTDWGRGNLSFSESPESKNSQPPRELRWAMRMFVPGSVLKTGACGDDPNGVMCAAGCHGGMKLNIPNPGVSGVASTAPLYEFFCRSRTYIKAIRTDARTTTIARTVARAITAADMIRLVVGCAPSDVGSDKGRNRLCHQDQSVVKTVFEERTEAH